jgi:hypothetical protein
MQSRNYFVGVTLSPYKSKHGYLQAELMAGIHTYIDSTKRQTITQFTDFSMIDRTSIQNDHKNIVLSLVPVSYRYTLNKFVGFGAGVQVSANLSEKAQHDALRETGRSFKGATGVDQQSIQRERTAYHTSDSFKHLNAALFGDIVLGSARIGPSLGCRYVYNLEGPHIQWQVYALWKF